MFPADRFFIFKCLDIPFYGKIQIVNLFLVLSFVMNHTGHVLPNQSYLFHIQYLVVLYLILTQLLFWLFHLMYGGSRWFAELIEKVEIWLY